MNYFRFAVALSTTVVLAVACTTPAPNSRPADSASITATRDHAIRDSVRTMLQEFIDKMSGGDLDGAGELYSNDSTFFWIESGLLQYRSAKQIRTSLQTLKNIPAIEMKLYETHIDVLSPTVASVRTEFSQTFMTGIGKGDTYGGYMSITVTRDAEGWRMRNGHTSSRRPRP